MLPRWMFNLLDLLLKVKSESAFVRRRLKILHHDKYQEAFELLETVTKLDLSGNGNLLRYRRQIEDFIAKNKANFDIVWSDDEIADLTSHRHAGWDTISHQIDNNIAKKLKMKIERDVSLRVFRADVENYKKLLQSVFGVYQKKFTSLKKALPGFSVSGMSYTDAAVPAALQVSALAATMATFGIFLFGYAIYEKVREYHSQWNRSRFDKNKALYLKARTEKLLDKLCNDLSDDTVDLTGGKKGGDVYRELFGESIRAQIHFELSGIVQDLSRDSVGSWMKRTQLRNKTTGTGKGKINDIFDDVYKSYCSSIWKHYLTEGELRHDNECCGHFGRKSFKHPNGEEQNILVKTFNKSDISSKLMLCEEFFFRRTSAILPENILAFYGCCLDSSGFYLIFEDCQFDLATFIKNNPYEKRRVHREEQKKEFTEIGKQIAHGIHYLHERYVCHGSLKPTNILLKTSEGHQVVKLASVGTAFQQRVFANDSNDDTQYWAPELIAQSSLRPSKESDVFTFGLILLELWFRNTVQKIRNVDAIEDKHVRLLIFGCLLLDPTKRLTADSVLESFKIVKIKEYIATI